MPLLSVQLFARIVDIGKTYIYELVSQSARAEMLKARPQAEAY